MRKICQKAGVLFIVNDALEVALAIAADGVHLGQDDLPVAEAKKLMHPMGIKNFLVGCSTHSLEQALEAKRQGADYIGIGPVFATPTKPTYNPVGLELVKAVTSQIDTPHVAIGGIDATNVSQVLAAGAQRVAVVRAVCGAEDIAAAVTMKKAIVGRPCPPVQMNKKVTVHIPATSANLGPGFDVLGVALRLYNDVSLSANPKEFGPFRHAPHVVIDIEGEGAATLPRNTSNLVYRAAAKVFDRAKKWPKELHLKLVNRIPLSRGLGSSSAATLGGICAANALFGKPLR